MYDIEPEPPRIDRPRVFIYAIVFLATFFVCPAMELGSSSNWIIPIISMFLGVMVGGAGVSLMWAVLGTRVWWVRMAEGFGLIAAQGVLFLMGLVMVGHVDFKNLFASSLFFPLAFLIGLIPVLGYRAVTGTHLQMPWEDLSEERIASPSNVRQFDLSHILIAMTLVSIAFGLASLGVSSFRFGSDGLEVWAGFGIFILIVLGYVSLVALPCISAAIRIRHAAMGFGFVVGWASLIVLAFLVIIALLGSGIPPMEVQAIVLCFHCALVGAFYYSLKILQAGGYVLASSHVDRS